MRFLAEVILPPARTPGERDQRSALQSGLIDTYRAICYNNRPCGAVAQLGERLNGIQEVVGSIPIGSTRYSNSPPCGRLFSFLVPLLATYGATYHVYGAT